MNRKKPYGTGALVGRFQMLHAGHEELIGIAVSLCENVGIFVGSSQEEGTFVNPFSYETRKKMLKAVFGDSVSVFPLPDIGVGNTAAWGDYVLQKVVDTFGRAPDILISGKESRRLDWLSGEAGRTTAELYIPKTVDISATRMREFLLNDDFASWKTYSSRALWKMYPDLRKTVLTSKNNLRTNSI